MKIYVSYSTNDDILKTEGFRKIDEIGLQMIMEKHKLEIEKCLQPIKEAIEKENGTIVLNSDGIVDVNGFSRETHLGINKLLETLN